MRAGSGNANYSAVPFLSRAAVNLCWYCIIPELLSKNTICRSTGALCSVVRMLHIISNVIYSWEYPLPLKLYFSQYTKLFL